MTITDSFISGIGDEVLIAFAAIFIVTLTLIILFTWSRRSIEIHPDNRDVIELVRSALHAIRSSVTASAVTLSTSPPTGNIDDEQQTTLEHRLNRYNMDSQCPVCLNDATYPVETNCGHIFCAQCIIVYYRHNTSGLSPVPCPVCRQIVNVLLICFRRTLSPNEPENRELQQIITNINDYNRKFSRGPRPWLSYLWELPTLLRHLSSEMFTVGGLMYMFRIRIVLCFIAAIMYLISPLDMIPEAIFGLFGLLDDLFVLLLLAVYVTIIYRRFLARRYQDDIFETN